MATLLAVEGIVGNPGYVYMMNPGAGIPKTEACKDVVVGSVITTVNA